jgi:hypothetical protein
VTPEKLDDAMLAKIRTEGMDRSKIMWIEHYLTDVYGPRPTDRPITSPPPTGRSRR